MAKRVDGSTFNETNIQVVVRCRGRNEMEKRGNFPSIVDCNESRKHTVDVKCTNHQTKTFTFDKVFGPTATQQELYKDVAANTLTEVLKGYDCTIFAYGQTGTGKTYTMEGVIDEESESWTQSPQAGIIPRVLNHLFDKLESSLKEFSVRVSFVEIYNEELRDLLGLNDSKKLRLLNDSQGSVVVDGMEEVPVTDKQEVYKVLLRGSQRRQVASTNMNSHSSRSHTIFTVYVHIKETNDRGEELIRMGKLNLVDLAGSENIGRSGAVSVRAREAGNINKSLHALGRVITQLVERTAHISYRDSLLTRMLQDSLGGKSKTTIIATISPASSNSEETLSTLDYAARAKNIKNRPEKKATLTKRTFINEYDNEIVKLRKDLHAAREKNGVYLSADTYNELQQNLEVKNSECDELKAEYKTMEANLAESVNLQLAAQEELGQVLAVLSSTESDLESTRHKLNATREDLALTRTEMEKKDFLLSKRIETENALHTEATQLTSTINSMANDISNLRSHAKSLHDTESSNTQSAKHFEDEIKTQCARIADEVNMFSDIQKKSISDLKKLLSVHVKKTTSEYKSAQTRTEEVRKGLSEKLSMLLKVSKDALEGNVAIAGNIVNITKSTQLEIITKGAEETIQSLVKMIQSSLDNMKTESDILHNDVLLSSAKMTEASQQGGQKQVELLKVLQNTLDTRIKAEAQKLIDLETTSAAEIQSHRQYTNTFYEKMAADMLSLVSANMAACKSLTLESVEKYDKRTAAVVSEVTQGLRSVPGLYQKGFQNANENILKTDNLVGKTCDGLKEVFNKNQKIVNDEVATASTATRRVETCITEANTTVTGSMSALRSDIVSEYTNMQHNVSNSISVHEQNVEDATNLTKNDIADISAQVAACQDSLRHHKMLFETQVAKAVDDIANYETIQNEIVESTNLASSKYISAMKKSLPLPTPTTYTYPSKLTITPACNVLLDQFNAILEAEAKTPESENREKCTTQDSSDASFCAVKRGHDEVATTPHRTPRARKRCEFDANESPALDRTKNKIPGREDRNSFDNMDRENVNTLNFSSPLPKAVTPRTYKTLSTTQPVTPRRTNAESSTIVPESPKKTEAAEITAKAAKISRLRQPGTIYKKPL
eukprot:CFRG5184T1